LNENAEEGLRDLQQILQIENINFAVRIGDIYSLLIEYHANRQRWKQAFTVLQEMRETIPESSIRYYINPNLIMAIHRELNIEYKMPANRQENYMGKNENNNQMNDDEDDIRDNIDYGTYED
jgi:pentatricopeptide repeat protein